MAIETMKVRSCVTPDLKKRVLFRGTLLATIGFLPILYCGTFMPVDQLKIWGLPVLLIGGAFVTVGLLPYRRLTLLEVEPYEIEVEGDIRLHFGKSGKKLLSIQRVSIECLEWVDDGKIYGIGVKLKDPLPEKIAVHDRSLDMKTFTSRPTYDLFFPYFSEKALWKIRL